MTINKKYFILNSYSFSHMIIDFVCASLVLSLGSLGIIDTTTLINFIILYNILAFGLQTPIGYLADAFKISKILSLVSCILLVISIFTLYLNFALICVVITGIANACFHIGGGVTTLALNPGKASIPGIFVAPGALGLFLGIIYGNSGLLIGWDCILLLLLAFFSMLFSSLKFNPYDIAAKYYQEEITKGTSFKIPSILIICLLFISIIIRSMVGFLLNYSWKSEFLLGIFFIACIVGGKFFGGFLADKFGRKKIGVGSLLLSLPCLLLGEQYFLFGMLGIFLFNITMPIAFSGMIKAYPGRRGLMFGLLCLALLVGAFPMLFNVHFNNNIIVIIYLILLSAILIFTALNSLRIKE